MDPEQFSRRMEELKEYATTTYLNGRRIVEQDNGIVVAVFDLPQETHVGLVIRSKISHALAS